MATLYTPDEMAFVRRVIDAMFDKYNTPAKETMAVKVTEAIRLGKVTRTSIEAATQHASLTMERAENIVEGLVEDDWFDRSSAGYLTLSTRSLMELGQWLVDTYNDPDLQDDEWQRIKTCEGCKQIVTAGQRCSDQSCLCRLHDYCVQTFFHAQESRPCPTCKKEWTERHFVGERVESSRTRS
jgi:hypothetical protein